MKTLTHSLKWMLIVSGLFLATACGNNKKGGGSSGNGAVVNPGVCANCAGIAQPILLTNLVSESAHPTDFPVSIVNGQMYGTAGGVGTVAQTAYNVYVGPVTIQGTFSVAQPIGDENARYYGGNQGCVINPGNYAMTTVQVGQMSNATNLSIPEIMAGGNIRMQLSSGMMWKDTNGVVRVKGILTIKSVAGRNCGAFFTNIQ
ncbi:MAG: hypothetical protein ACLGGX_06455 [Bdellovibrionia bacterium]